MREAQLTSAALLHRALRLRLELGLGGLEGLLGVLAEGPGQDVGADDLLQRPRDAGGVSRELGEGRDGHEGRRGVEDLEEGHRSGLRSVRVRREPRLPVLAAGAAAGTGGPEDAGLEIGAERDAWEVA